MFQQLKEYFQDNLKVQIILILIWQKASLNMMTRTSGSHYANTNIFMNAVDTGWVTDENPLSF